MTPYDPTLIVTADNWHDIVRWAHDAGHGNAHLMTAPQLANLYHEHGASATIRAAVAQAVIDTLAIMSLPIVPVAVIDAPPPITHYCTDKIMRVIRRGHPVMMVGPAGCGKTTIAETAAVALAFDFYITSVVNDTHELLGFIDGYGNYHGSPFRSAYENGGIWCADEIDAWDAASLLVANSALANGLCTFPDRQTPIRRHDNFRMVATANTFGTGADRVYVGRNELDAASLDRFAVVDVDYDLELERMFAAGRDDWLEYVWKVRKAVTAKKIRHVVSSRAIRFGAEALNDGDEWDSVCDMYLWKGIADADRSKVK